jgi:Na+-transporting methylmalonyl-CoA/oxaloacetate decarboxylase gamma subunit
MGPVDWGHAFQIVVGGVAAVFCIMMLLALSTHYMGKLVQGYEKRKREKAQAKEASS